MSAERASRRILSFLRRARSAKFTIGRPLLGSLWALALAAGLAACGGGGTSSRATTFGQAAVSAHGASTTRPLADPCTRTSACTAAARASGTFWPTRGHTVPQGDGAVTYAPLPGELIPGPGEMALASPAFGLNEALPRAYTCDGAGVSPPLEWRHVPAHAAALLLLEIDLGSGGPAGRIRWIVADIDPAARGVAGGRVPAGGVVGADAEGKAAYGALCPPPGKEAWVKFQLYALSRKAGLAPGFTAAQAKSAYAGHLIEGGAAATYALYLREG